VRGRKLAALGLLFSGLAGQSEKKNRKSEKIDLNFPFALFRFEAKITKSKRSEKCKMKKERKKGKKAKKSENVKKAKK
jgi:hypothetical protein